MKIAEHQDDTAILFQMCDRLHATADQIDVCNRCGTENAKGIEALGREIDTSARTKWRSGYKKDVLVPKGLRKTIVDV